MSKRQSSSSKPENDDSKNDDSKRRKISVNGDKDDILTYLLLDSTLDSISPDEIVHEKEECLRYPHSDLAPFCALVSALLLSKPFSHKLGMRAIHQLLNPPYSFTTPKSILDAPDDTIWQALNDAQTLHKQKTASQLRKLAQLMEQTYPEDIASSDMTQFRKAAGGNIETLEKMVCRVNGVATKTATLFFRRVQFHWTELFPYADTLALEAARELGLVADSAQDLLDLLKTHLGHDDDDLKQETLRRQYVRLLDVLVSKKLDKDIDNVEQEATDALEKQSEENETISQN